MNKNYYNILGVTDDEKKLQGKDFENAIKPKFRKLAMKYHPDKQQGKSEAEKKKAEEKFKEVSEAYEVLSSEEKRKKYDNPMGGNMGGFDFSGFGGFGDFMSQFGDFGMNFGRRNQQMTPKGQSQRITIGLTLEEVYNGCKKTIKYKRYDKCKTCNGNGTTANSRVETCSYCGGTGQIIQQDGNWQQISTCPHCHGKGTTIKNPCPHCGGNGIVLTDNEVEITIPKGIDSDYQQIIKGGGNAPLNCKGEYGDLIINYQNIENDKFERHGSTLVCEIDVNVVDALLGTVKEVETIDGKKINTRIPQGIENGTQLRFNGKGLPYYNTNQYGDMIGIVKLKVPKNLTEEEKKLLEKLKKCDNFK